MTANTTYALVDADDRVESVVLWDGETAWVPPPGMRAIACTGPVESGWRVDRTGFIPPSPQGE